MSGKGKRGWTWLFNARKWHYFSGNSITSLCGRWMLPFYADGRDFEDSNHNSPDNCKECLRELTRRGGGE